MSFTSRNAVPQQIDGRTVGEPHPDAQRNFEYCLHKMKEIELLKSMEYVYQDTKPNNNCIVDPKCIFFSWQEGSRNHANPLTFHVESIQFQSALTNCIQWMIEKGYATRKQQTRMKNSFL